MTRGKDTYNNTAARIIYDPQTDIREVAKIIRDRKVVAHIKRHGHIVSASLRGWGYTHHVEVPYEANRTVGYAISGDYHINLK